MKSIYFKIVKVIIGISVLFMISCTGGFEDMNTPPFGVTDEELAQDNNFIGMHFPSLQKSIYYNPSGWGWDFQLAQNLSSDIWSGYMASPTNFEGGVNNQTYAIVKGWTDYSWNSTYSAVMTNQLKVQEKCEQLGLDVYGHFSAVNTIIRVFAMVRIVDEYGPIIYSKYGESMTGGVYDDDNEVYKLFFEELKDASKVLNEFVAKGVYASFSKFDLAYKGDMVKWLKLCNTLRLRLALRIVKYDESLARKEAESAIADPAGLLGEGDKFTVSGYGWNHPLQKLSIEWNDIHINANIVSIMGGYNDPRLEKFAIASGDKIVGIRSGIPGLDESVDKYKEIVSRVSVTPTTPGLIMSAAESYFLLAEAALRGWQAGGDAKTFYEKGIQTSFTEHGASIGNYLSSDKIPAAWIDPLVPEFNASAVSKVSPRWEDGADNEVKLEKIITQKWIAGFPEGKNAWAEWRRTGYPELFQILKNDSQGVISTELGVRRIPFPQSEISKNPEGYKIAVEYLGGEDNGATRLFWDVDKNNF